MQALHTGLQAEEEEENSHVEPANQTVQICQGYFKILVTRDMSAELSLSLLSAKAGVCCLQVQWCIDESNLTPCIHAFLLHCYAVRTQNHVW